MRWPATIEWIYSAAIGYAAGVAVLALCMAFGVDRHVGAASEVVASRLGFLCSVVAFSLRRRTSEIN